MSRLSPRNNVTNSEVWLIGPRRSSRTCTYSFLGISGGVFWSGEWVNVESGKTHKQVYEDAAVTCSE